MRVFQIKILAITAMLIDHIGLFFFPQITWLRIIGRIAFPLFAWLIANGAYHTHNIKQYALRLLIFAVISQVPFFLTNQLITPQFIGLNVLFTLFLGLVAIYGIKKMEFWAQRFFIIVVCGATAELLHVDYGAFGVGVIVLFYLFFNNFRLLFLTQLLLFGGNFLLSLPNPTIEIWGLCALVFVALYNNKLGIKAQYLFYIVYPLQYVVFYFILKRIL
jgi:TraX protein